MERADTLDPAKDNISVDSHQSQKKNNKKVPMNILNLKNLVVLFIFTVTVWRSHTVPGAATTINNSRTANGSRRFSTAQVSSQNT